jgi:hypothetical protein
MGEEWYTVENRGERVRDGKWLKTSAFGAKFTPICALLKKGHRKTRRKP